MLPINDATRALATQYLQAGIFPRTENRDALHVAAAVLNRHDVILSWNFKHLVNRRRRAMVNAMNIALGASAIDIISPPEL